MYSLRMHRFPLTSLFIALVVCCLAVDRARSQNIQEAAAGNKIQFEAFVRGDLPAAQQVAEYTAALQQRFPGLAIVTHDVLQDRQQLQRLHELTKKYGRDKAVVPAFLCCNRMYFGFSGAEKSGPSIEALFTADVYTRSTCPRCQAAKGFLAELHKRWPGIQFREYEVTQDSQARARWESLCRGAGTVPGLPTIDFANHVLIGYQGDAVTGAQLERIIEKFAATDQAQPAAAENAPATDTPQDASPVQKKSR